MIFRQSVRHLIAMRGDALGARNVYEREVARVMRRFGHVANRLQLFFGMQKALVAPGNIIVDFNPENTALLRAAHNLHRVPALEPVRTNANVVAPVLIRQVRAGSCALSKQQEAAPAERECGEK